MAAENEKDTANPIWLQRLPGSCQAAQLGALKWRSPGGRIRKAHLGPSSEWPGSCHLQDHFAIGKRGLFRGAEITTSTPFHGIRSALALQIFLWMSIPFSPANPAVVRNGM